MCILNTNECQYDTFLRLINIFPKDFAFHSHTSNNEKIILSFLQESSVTSFEILGNGRGKWVQFIFRFSRRKAEPEIRVQCVEIFR